jgi:uncharacterized protein YceH (UPF0502 family)
VILDIEQGRVIGCLVEKQLTTPQQYPLTLNALVLACNQTSNRDPIVIYDNGLVQRTLASLKEAGLVRFVYPSSGRSATRFRQVFDEHLGLDAQALALVAVLLLRGPQTPGELRSRTERMATFGGIDAVVAELEQLGARPEPLVRQLARRPGQKEERWMQLLTPGMPTAEVLAGTSGKPADHELDLETESRRSPRRIDPIQCDDESSASDYTGKGFLDLVEEFAALKAEVAVLRAAVELLESRLSL